MENSNHPRVASDYLPIVLNRSILSLPVGGRLSLFANCWAEITQDQWVLEVVNQGLLIEFAVRPPVSTEIVETQIPQGPESEFLTQEIESLVKKRAVERVNDSVLKNHPGFSSRIFLVPKVSGGWRMILNLKKLNSFLVKKKFKMESLRSILLNLSQGLWVCKLDLQDAYLHVPIRKTHRRFLRFAFKGRVYQFQTLPFGLSSAPRVFTKITVALIAHLRKKGIHVHAFLDDWMFVNKDPNVLVDQMKFVLKLLERLGFLVNQEKSVLIPTQVIEYLGASLRLDLGVVQITEPRWEKIQQMLLQFVVGQMATAHQLLMLLGLMASCIDLIPLARLHMRPVQFFLLSQWRPNSHDLWKKIRVTQVLINALHWWSERQNLFRGRSLLLRPAQLTLTTDASQRGWGGHLEDLQAGGPWSQDLRKFHINWLELKAIHLSLLEFKDQLKGKVILVRCDNSTAVAYIKNQGGTRSPDLCALLWEILLWCDQNQIELRASHLAGKKNYLADALSRGKILPTEWTLNQAVLERVFHKWGTPQIDMFASRFNNRLPFFCTRSQDVRAAMTDASAQSWKSLFLYAYPPQVLIPQVLLKIKREPCEVILIAPNWPRQPWYPNLVDLLVDEPLELPKVPSLIVQPRSLVEHPSIETLALTAWRLSSVNV
jgi:hypothetical protein